MKTAQLEKALNYCKGSLLNVDFIPALTHFFFSPNGKVLAYNDTTAVIAELEGSELNCGIQGDTLLQLLPTLREEVEFVQHEDKVTIKSGRLNLDLPTLPSDACPFTEPFSIGKQTKQVPLQPQFLTSLETCCETVSDNAVQKALSCVAIKMQKQGTTLFSSNNVSLSCVQTDAGGVDAECMVLGTSCKQILALAKATGLDGAVLYFTKDWVAVKLEGVMMFTRLVTDAVCPDYQDILERMCPKHEAKMPDGFLSALQRAKILTAKDVDARISIDTTEARIRVSAAGALGKFVEDFLKAKTTPSLSIALKPELLANAAATVNDRIGLGEEAVGLFGENVIRLVATVKG